MAECAAGVWGNPSSRHAAGKRAGIDALAAEDRTFVGYRLWLWWNERQQPASTLPASDQPSPEISRSKEISPSQ